MLAAASGAPSHGRVSAGRRFARVVRVSGSLVVVARVPGSLLPVKLGSVPFIGARVPGRLMPVKLVPAKVDAPSKTGELYAPSRCRVAYRWRCRALWAARRFARVVRVPGSLVVVARVPGSLLPVKLGSVPFIVARVPGRLMPVKLVPAMVDAPSKTGERYASSVVRAS